MRIFGCQRGFVIGVWLGSLLLGATSQAALPWEPDQSKAGPVTPESVRIVKQGMETHRNDDGSMYSISSMTRYKTVRNETTGLMEKQIGSIDREMYHDFDVDGDGIASNDSVETHPFSMTNTLSPDGPFYDTSIGTHRMYGGSAIYTAKTTTPFGYSEDGMNDYEEGYAYQPRRNWSLHNIMYGIYTPFRMYGVFLWSKEDFLNGGADYPVSFDANSVLAHLVMRYYMGIEGFRWVVRNNDQFYISEAIYQYADEIPGRVGGKVHQLIPTQTQWAEYNPGEGAPYRIDFDTNSASYSSPAFTNITAVGYYMYKDQLISGYLGHKWYTFEAHATVHRPALPSELIDMVEVPGSGGVQDFYLATCETPYTLWRKVYRQANNNCFTLSPRGTANFDNDGDMGSMDYPDTNGVYLSHGPNEPVTDVTLHDVLLWCNALSVQESREPVYYTDPTFTNVYSEAEHNPFWLKAPTNIPVIYVKWAADGFRLPTPKEWERAHTAGLQSYTATDGWIGSNSTGTTHEVGGLSTNALGIYDMAGNVWEMVWPFGDSLDLSSASALTALGGGFHYPSSPTNYSGSAYGDRPYDGNYNIGFRLVRRDAGVASPDTSSSITNAIPQWSIAANDQNAVVPARQISVTPGTTWLSQKKIPAESYAMGLTEVTFAEWKPVYDWAVANGYGFDYDGDMGSMDYWGWGTNWTPGVHGPNEPVTGITRYDAITWLNALSVLEGRTPVYCTSSNLLTAVTTSAVYRPLQTTLGEVSETDLMSWDAMGLWPGIAVNPSANGYRLPNDTEFYYVAHAGGTSKYPWGTDVTLMTNYAWVIDNSGLRTHDVAQLSPNAWGFYDMLGNVSELSDSAGVKLAGLSKLRLGLGFFDLTGGYPFSMDRGTWSGLCYPDCGLRVLRQNATTDTAALPADWNQEFAPLRFAESDLPDFDGTVMVSDFVFNPADFDNLKGKVHRGDLGRSGVFNATGLPASPRQRWKFQTGGPVKSSPVVVDGVAYFGSYDGAVYAVNAASGLLIWSNQTGDRVSGSAAVVSNTVFIAGENQKLYAFDAATGATNWTATLDADMRCAGSPAVAYGAVFIGSGEKYGAEVVSMGGSYIYGFDMNTGDQVWKSALRGPQGFAAIAMDTNTIYAGIDGCTYGAFHLISGLTKWNKDEGSQNRQFRSMSVIDGSVYIPGTMRGSVSKYSTSGTRSWQTTTLEQNDDDGEFEMNSGGLFGYEILTDLAVANGQIYAGCNDGKLHTFDQTSGTRGWTFQTGGKVQSSPSVASNIVYFGSWDGKVYAVDAINGSEVWNYDLGTRTVSDPWIADGTLTIGCDDGAVYGLESEVDTDSDGMPDWWENLYFGNPTSADPSTIAANGTNILLECYEAGLDPTDPNATEPDPSIVTAVSILLVPEGSTASLGFTLSRNPHSALTVTVSRVSGDTELSLSGSSNFVFTSGNWSVTQTVSFTAAEDEDSTWSTALFRFSSDKATSADVTLQEQDNETPLLRVDFGITNSVVESNGAWQAFAASSTSEAKPSVRTYTLGASNILITLNTTSTLLGKDRSNPSTNAGALTYAGVYRDFIQTSAAADLALTLEGLTPSTVYNLRGWIYDYQYVNSGVFSVTNTTGGANTLLGQVTNKTGVTKLPTNNVMYSWAAAVTSDVSGTISLKISGTATEGGRINGLEIEDATPPVVSWLLTTGVNNPAWGSVLPAGGLYAAGTTVQVSVVASAYYHFVQWTGDVSGVVSPTNILMSGNRTVWAQFAETLTTNSTPQWWLAEYGLGTNDAAALSDTDGDGLSAWEEYIAGTLPNSGNSVFAISNYWKNPQGHVLQWQAVSGRVYSIYWSSNLVSGVWSQLSANAEGTYTDTVHEAESKGFYRIKVRLSE